MADEKNLEVDSIKFGEDVPAKLPNGVVAEHYERIAKIVGGGDIQGLQIGQGLNALIFYRDNEHCKNITFLTSAGDLYLQCFAENGGENNRVYSDVPVNAPSFEGNLKGKAAELDATYTVGHSLGNMRPPSYVGAKSLKAAMMRLDQSKLMEYSDCILMDGYWAQDQPLATFIAVTKTEKPKMFIASGDRSSNNVNAWNKRELAYQDQIEELKQQIADLKAANNLV